MNHPITSILILGNLLWAGILHADPGMNQGCVVLGDEVYLAALRIEMQKSGLDWKWEATEKVQDCSVGQPIVTFTDTNRATLTLGNGTKQSYILDSVEAQSRARTLARGVAGALTPEPAAETMPLIGSNDKLNVGKGSDSKPTTPAKGYAWWARAGGAYFYQLGSAQHVAGVMLEPGLSFYDGRLAFSLSAAYGVGSEYSLGGSTAVTHQSTELIAMTRGGFKLDTLVLRGGLGMGWHHGVLSSNTEDERLVANLAAVDVGVVGLDAELLWNFASGWHLGLLVASRIYLGETGHIEGERTYYESFPAALGTELTLGFTL